MTAVMLCWKCRQDVRPGDIVVEFGRLLVNKTTGTATDDFDLVNHAVLHQTCVTRATWDETAGLMKLELE